MTRSQTLAYKFRWIILTVGLIATVLGAVWVIGFELKWLGIESAGVAGTPATWGAWIAQIFGIGGEGIAAGVFLVGVVLVAQWFFLRPRRGWTIQFTQIGKPLKTSVIAAAFMAMLLTTGFVTTLLEIPNWWEKITLLHGPGSQSEIRTYWIWAEMFLVWLLWSVLFFLYWKQGDRYTQLGQMLRGLIAGSFLELIVATPVHIWIARNRECYCARGSYTGLVFGFTVLLWCFGPGVILLFLREKYRCERLMPTCFECGYDLRGTLAAERTECPECGASISPYKPDEQS